MVLSSAFALRLLAREQLADRGSRQRGTRNQRPSGPTACSAHTDADEVERCAQAAHVVQRGLEQHDARHDRVQVRALQQRRREPEAAARARDGVTG
jgi:hypothetical protein